MKKRFPVIIILAVMAVFLLSGTYSYSVDINTEQCRQMLLFGDQAVAEEDFEAARNYYKRAIQYDPWNITAWKKYDAFVLVVNGDKEVDLSGLEFGALPEDDDEEEESGGGLFDFGDTGGGGGGFEGC